MSREEDLLEGVDLSTLNEEELDALYSELKTLDKISPLDYIPHPSQLLFHKANNKIRLFCGGNRSGKTEAGAMEALYHSTGLYPKWYPEELKLKTHNRGRIIVSDYAKGGDVITEKILKWLPKELIVHTRKTMKGHLDKLYVKHVSGGTSEIEVLTHEMDDNAFEGWSGHWIWADEPPPREQYIASVRGLIDFSGRAWLTMTPISEPWIYDDLVMKESEDVLYLTVSMTDNPYIPIEEIKKFEAMLTDDEKESRLLGKFRHLTGLVYKEFDSKVHVIPEASIKISRNWPTYFVLDPADRRPHHGLWIKVDPFNTIYVVQEIVYAGTIDLLAKEIFKREILMGIKPMEVVRILDPNKGVTPSVVSGLKLNQEFAKHGLYFNVNVNDDVVLGHLAVAEKLRWDKKQPLSRTNCPKLYFIKENTKECVRQFLGYIWQEWKGADRDRKSPKEEPRNLNKDFPDCVRYSVVFPVSYFEDEVDPGFSRSGSVTGYNV